MQCLNAMSCAYLQGAYNIILHNMILQYSSTCRVAAQCTVSCRVAATAPNASLIGVIPTCASLCAARVRDVGVGETSMPALRYSYHIISVVARKIASHSCCGGRTLVSSRATSSSSSCIILCMSRHVVACYHCTIIVLSGPALQNRPSVNPRCTSRARWPYARTRIALHYIILSLCNIVL